MHLIFYQTLLTVNIIVINNSDKKTFTASQRAQWRTVEKYFKIINYIIKCLNQIISENKPYNLHLCNIYENMKNKREGLEALE